MYVTQTPKLCVFNWNVSHMSTRTTPQLHYVPSRFGLYRSFSLNVQQIWIVLVSALTPALVVALLHVYFYWTVRWHHWLKTTDSMCRDVRYYKKKPTAAIAEPEIRYESDFKPHIVVAKIRYENNLLWFVHISEKKNQIWVTNNMNIALELFLYPPDKGQSNIHPYTYIISWSIPKSTDLEPGDD